MGLESRLGPARRSSFEEVHLAAGNAGPFRAAARRQQGHRAITLADLAAVVGPHLPHESPAEAGWMTSRQAAAHLGLTLHALHRLTAARAVPFEQDTPGGKCWFNRADLDAWRRGSSGALPPTASKSLPYPGKR